MAAECCVGRPRRRKARWVMKEGSKTHDEVQQPDHGIQVHQAG